MSSANEQITPEFVEAKRGKVLVRVPIEEITHFRFDHKLVTAYYAGGELLLVASLVKIEQILGGLFIRVNKGSLVAVDKFANYRESREFTNLTGWVTVRGVPGELRVTRRLRVIVMRHAASVGVINAVRPAPGMRQVFSQSFAAGAAV